MRCCALMRYYQPFPAAIPLDGPGYPHVTHPSATKLQQDLLCTSTPLISVAAPFDLHVLGTPPAFILSQDRTLDNNISRFYVYRISIGHPTFVLLSVLNVASFFASFPFTAQRINFCPVFFRTWFSSSGLHCCSVFKVLRRRRDLNSRAGHPDLHP